MSERPVIITSGEPAGIGPDITLKFSQKALRARENFAILGCLKTLRDRANLLNLELEFEEFAPEDSLDQMTLEKISVIDFPCSAKVLPGTLDPKNINSVMSQIDHAIALCKSNKASAMVTCPVQKSLISEQKRDFMGHTEYIANVLKNDNPVMVLASPTMMTALLTTHIPLAEVARMVTKEKIIAVVEVLNAWLEKKFLNRRPKIAVLGLNPHAGESGKLGQEEIEVIGPAIELLRNRGINAEGPLSADTAFNDLAKFDLYLGMYHDQVLPVIKSHFFETIVNITVGIDIIRTSVDHGTALDKAGTHQASEQSLVQAFALAKKLANA